MESLYPSIPSFPHVCSLISLGQRTLVQELLQQNPEAYPDLERVCLQAWMACEPAYASDDLNDDEKEECWQKASEIFENAKVLLLFEVPGASDYFARPEGTLRRRRPWMLWLLGNLAAHLSYLSVELYQQALHLLDERRMNVPWLRMQVLSDQAQTLLQLQSPHEAIACALSTLRLCREAPELPERTFRFPILLCLCQAYASLEDHTQALFYGQSAREICPEKEARQQLLPLLGQLYQQVGQQEEARQTYQEALLLAEEAVERIALQGVLALLLLENGQIAEAQQAYELALREDHDTLAADVRGRLYQFCGTYQHKLAMAGTPEPPDLRGLQESVSWYLFALEHCPKDPGMRSEFAQLLSDILESDTHASQASWWRKAYRCLTQQL